MAAEECAVSESCLCDLEVDVAAAALSATIYGLCEDALISNGKQMAMGC